jgi:hypothetical protein
MITFEQALDAVMELPFEQREMLVDIVRRRDVEQRRKQLAADAQAALAEYRSGSLKPMSAAEVIAQLSQFDDE